MEGSIERFESIFEEIDLIMSWSIEIEDSMLERTGLTGTEGTGLTSKESNPEPWKAESFTTIRTEYWPVANAGTVKSTS
jgi:hypothetical protein